MYKGKTMYTKIALKSILEEFGQEKNYREEYKDEEKLKERKACFVTLHMKSGDLRGCIGTLEPYRGSLLEEIIGNAKSAAFEDPRFNKVRREELEKIEISVDVLERPEKIESKDELDPKVYGVIVVKDGRKGVLLPDLEGIDTADQQVGIAMKKAGIQGDEAELYRFKVNRYH